MNIWFIWGYYKLRSDCQASFTQSMLIFVTEIVVQAVAKVFTPDFTTMLISSVVTWLPSKPICVFCCSACTIAPQPISLLHNVAQSYPRVFNVQTFCNSSKILHHCKHWFINGKFLYDSHLQVYKSKSTVRRVGIL